MNGKSTFAIAIAAFRVMLRSFHARGMSMSFFMSRAQGDRSS